MPPFGMYAMMAPRSAAPRAPEHSNPIAKRSHTSHGDRSSDFRAPKGRSIPAQGNALGIEERSQPRALKGRENPCHNRYRIGAPSSGEFSGGLPEVFTDVRC